MSWKRIKTFLILLFLIINIYLLMSTEFFRFRSVTEFDSKNISKTVDVINKNFGIEINKNIIPKQIVNLNIIDVDNILFSDMLNDNYQFQLVGSDFEVMLTTNTFSYNEKNASDEIVDVLKNMGIKENTYKMTFYMTDGGLVCVVNEYIKGYPIFNGRLNVSFSSNSIRISGSWYFPKTNSVESGDTSLRMTDISGVLVDMAYTSSVDSASTPKSITKIDYGYFVSSYDENVISKTASAVPCYMIETDDGSKYYYDVFNGKLLKQEG